uniref:Anthranilate synthase component 2 n=1 Tax=Compsopogon caeruleus TaxID=31354 RepID=A0A1Z1XAZ4_9RHOD|nr:anthranilate synthase component 2 [Compsopogon caeruleus]ARX95986.1 anthranilate synthase component 2 [Compsopogon caeruleus]
MILLIDNYDSFTYNLVQYIGEKNYPIVVYRNDKINIEEIYRINPDKIIISPGPGRPEKSGICLDIIKEFGEFIPILGVCLGHQAIGCFYGSEVIKVNKLMHGKTSNIYHNGDVLFKGVPSPFIATRYHSLIINSINMSSYLSVIAWTNDNIIMGCKHRVYHKVYGIQFHPESILTEYGRAILSNFLKL